MNLHAKKNSWLIHTFDKNFQLSGMFDYDEISFIKVRNNTILEFYGSLSFLNSYYESDKKLNKDLKLVVQQLGYKKIEDVFIQIDGKTENQEDEQYYYLIKKSSILSIKKESDSSCSIKLNNFFNELIVDVPIKYFSDNI